MKLKENTGYLMYVFGIFLAIFSSFSLKYFNANNIFDIYEVIFFRNLFNAIILLRFEYKNFIHFYQTKKQFKLIIAYCLFVLIDLYFWNYAIINLSISNISLFTLILSPIVMFTLSNIFLKESSSLNIKISIIISIIGALFILDISYDKNPIGYLILFCSVIAFGMINVLSKKIEYESGFLAFIRFVFILPFAFFLTKDLTIILNLKCFFIILFLSLMHLLERILFIQAMKISNLKNLQSFRSCNLIFSNILNYFFFGIIINQKQLIGIFIILFSVFYFALREKQLPKSSS